MVKVTLQEDIEVDLTSLVNLALYVNSGLLLGAHRMHATVKNITNKGGRQRLEGRALLQYAYIIAYVINQTHNVTVRECTSKLPDSDSIVPISVRSSDFQNVISCTLSAETKAV